MKPTEFNFLTSPEGLALVEQHIDDDPARLALKLRHPAVTRQIQMLQRCRTKLPGYHSARCIVPPIAYEQASSEATAAARTAGILDAIPDGERRLAIDLTCGLGVDSLALSRAFERVVTVETDPLRAAIARWNFSRLGADNITVVHASAEEFVAALPDAYRNADLIYVDPSRKQADGKRVYSIEESSPDILQMLPTLRTLARHIVVKLSPLFDVAEVYRLFGPGACAEVISLDGECKEVLAKVGFAAEAEATPYLRTTVIRHGQVRRFDFSQASLDTPFPSANRPDELPILLVPDVAFYKARAVAAYAAVCLTHGTIAPAGEYLVSDRVPADFAGTAYRITQRMPYRPKEVARTLRSRGIRRINIHRRGFPVSAEQIARTLGVTPGGANDLFVLTLDGQPTALFVDRID